MYDDVFRKVNRITEKGEYLLEIGLAREKNLQENSNFKVAKPIPQATIDEEGNFENRLHKLRDFDPDDSISIEE